MFGTALKDRKGMKKVGVGGQWKKMKTKNYNNDEKEKMR